MPVEIERKFLVNKNDLRDIIKRMRLKGTEQLQGYLCINEQRTIRIRVAGEESFVTIKGKVESQSRKEFEYEIPMQDALILLHASCLRPLIRKTRYRIHYDENNFWEVDEFHDENEGLIIAEMELVYPTQFLIKPYWVGEEVTDDERYYNARLVSYPYKSWK